MVTGWRTRFFFRRRRWSRADVNAATPPGTLARSDPPTFDEMDDVDEDADGELDAIMRNSRYGFDDDFGLDEDMR